MKDHPELQAFERRQRVRDVAKLVGAGVLGPVLGVLVWPLVGWVFAAAWSVLLP